MASAADQQRHAVPQFADESPWQMLASGIVAAASREDILAGGLIVAAFVVRLILTVQGWPALNSDEALYGITALHIARDGIHPIWAYGEWYLGDIEAYLAAPLFYLFGASLLTLRFGLIVMFLLFLVVMYALTAMLYSKRAALVALIVLGAGPIELLFHELSASGGYPETLLFGSILFLLATWLAVTSSGDRRASTRWRAAAFAGWGLAAGLGVWSDPLILPEVLAAGLLLMVFCWRELLGWRGMLLLVGCGIGILPDVLYNVSAPPGLSTLDIVRTMQNGGAEGPGITPQTSLLGTLFVSLPNMTGATALCQLTPAQAWPLSAHTSAGIRACTAVRAAWGLGFLTLWALAVALSCWRMWRSATRTEPATGRRPAMAGQAARLAVLVGAGITLALYAHSPDPGLDPWSNSRYLYPLLIAFPVVMGPLWEETAGRVRRAQRKRVAVRLLRASVIVCICVVFVAGTFQTFQGAGKSVAVAHMQQQQLSGDLLRMGITRIYSEYWTCYSLAFVTQERIVCGLIEVNLLPGRDRVPTYHALVRAAPDAAYVFPLGSPEVGLMAHQKPPAGTIFNRFVIDGYVIFLPTRVKK